jgi:hypothetical protein
MSATHLHVVGCPRSGTTLMAEMLVACYPHEGHSEHEETIFKVPPQESGLRLSKNPTMRYGWRRCLTVTRIFM